MCVFGMRVMIVKLKVVVLVVVVEIHNETVLLVVVEGSREW